MINYYTAISCGQAPITSLNYASGLFLTLGWTEQRSALPSEAQAFLGVALAVRWLLSLAGVVCRVADDAISCSSVN